MKKLILVIGGGVGLMPILVMAADNNGESLAVRKKKESEAQADSAR